MCHSGEVLEFAWGVSGDDPVPEIASTDTMCRAACFSRGQVRDCKDGSGVRESGPCQRGMLGRKSHHDALCAIWLQGPIGKSTK